MADERITNRTFSESNKQFLAACSAAGVTPTLRQASKFRRKVGLAYTVGLPKLDADA